MYSLEQRLRRAEAAADINDPHAWIKHLSDEELERQLLEHHIRLQKLSDEYGPTIRELLELGGLPEHEAAELERFCNEYPWKAAGSA